MSKHHPHTQCIHGPQKANDPHGALTSPLYQTSTFHFENAAQGAARFAGDEPGYIYTRLGCLLYTSPSPRDATLSRMPSSA